jgi:transcriptional regulator with XRE-family HTH domain
LLYSFSFFYADSNFFLEQKVMKKNRRFSFIRKKKQSLELGQKFRMARLSKALTQHEVAVELGIGQSHYQKIETGNVTATPEQFLKLCILLSISLENYTENNAGPILSNNPTSHLIVRNSEENFISMQKAFEAVIRRQNKIISTQRRQMKNLMLDAYGVSV